MNFLSYKLVRDYGFAPNPFHGVCTLATCKPNIRKQAKVNDWIIGTGSSTRDWEGRLIYIMKVDGVMTFNEYWSDERFQCKKPVMNGSLVQIHGDNIYYHQGEEWSQLTSQHSMPDGTINHEHVKTDISGINVLFSYNFYYFGSHRVDIPKCFEDIICPAQGFKYVEVDLGISFIDWVSSSYSSGVHGNPIDWDDYKQRQLIF